MELLTEADFRQFLTLEEAGIKGGNLESQSRIGIANDGSRWMVKRGTGEEEDEVMAYYLAKLYFDGVVPETRPALIDGEVSSAQRMVTGRSAHDWAEQDLEDFYRRMRSPVLMRDLANMVCLDFMVGNTDRHGHNWIITSEERIAAIDNGFAGNDISVRFSYALEPAGRALLVDDCAHSPAFIALMKTVAYKLKGKAYEVHELGRSVSFNEDVRICLSCNWEDRVDELIAAIDKWRSTIGKFCGWTVYDNLTKSEAEDAGMQSVDRQPDFFKPTPQPKMPAHLRQPKAPRRLKPGEKPPRSSLFGGPGQTVAAPKRKSTKHQPAPGWSTYVHVEKNPQWPVDSFVDDWNNVNPGYQFRVTPHSSAKGRLIVERTSDYKPVHPEKALEHLDRRNGIVHLRTKDDSPNFVNHMKSQGYTVNTKGTELYHPDGELDYYRHAGAPSTMNGERVHRWYKT